MHWKSIRLLSKYLPTVSYNFANCAQTLRTLLLWRSQLDDEGAKYLADALKVNHVDSMTFSSTLLWPRCFPQTLHTLQLRSSDFSAEGVRYLADALKVNKVIAAISPHLLLSSNPCCTDPFDSGLLGEHWRWWWRWHPSDWSTRHRKGNTRVTCQSLVIIPPILHRTSKWWHCGSTSWMLKEQRIWLMRWESIRWIRRYLLDAWRQSTVCA